ncbi:hypothetical protein QQ056_02655 [Oscillatoria laete-virens NRMC-F 0139]|nr:hypothetical protein [Oscillatoria laete-virens]MDL5052464.1 hypothetical protein [Oscillatoria laete-virens NRMC-F 0139]
MSQPKPQIAINLPPEYELKLLTALAYFLGRNISAQALACLSMYLRQSEPRIMAQLRYYAHQASKTQGRSISEYELLDWIYESPERVDELLQQAGKVHHPSEIQDVFEPNIFSDESID